jgi:predicted negative regulator of RcsB-dependent stress response
VISSSEDSPSCTYIQYLSQLHEDDDHFQSPYREKRNYRINTSSYVKMSGLEIGEHKLGEIKRIAEDTGKMILVGVLIAGVLLLTFQKRRKGKHGKSFIRDLSSRIWSEDKKRAVKGWKEEKNLLAL